MLTFLSTPSLIVVPHVTLDLAHSNAQMKRHLCWLTPVHRDFPSSQPDQPPPHRIFEGLLPQLASQPLTPVSPLQASTVQSIFPSEVSLIDDINPPSTSAPLSAQLSSCPVAALPPQIPSTCCRLEDLNTFFSICDYLRCTEEGYGAIIM